jgi:peptide/nickel transport system permease protein
MSYFARKLCLLLLTLFIVSLLGFLAFQIIPGDPATHILGTSATPESIARLRAELGLDKPVAERYFTWLTGFLSGDGGLSYSYSVPVFSLLADKIPVTLTLTLLSFLLVIIIAFPLAVFIARHEGGVLDRVFTAVNQLVMSLPPFFIGIICTYVFGIILKLFMPGDFVSFAKNPGKHMVYLFFAALAIAPPRCAMSVKLLSGGVAAEMKKEYIRTAYSRGNSSVSALWRHALKNAALPMVTFLGLTFSDILAGSVIIEQVFAIPGIGRLLLISISNRDYPVVQSIVVFIAFVVVFANFAADLVNKRLDPRLRN